jgi:hypothetical protein
MTLTGPTATADIPEATARTEQTGRWPRHLADSGAIITELPVEGGTGRAVVSPAVGTLREEMAVSGQHLLAASRQMPMAAQRPAVRTVGAVRAGAY